MNLILLSKDDLLNSGKKARLSGRRHEHIFKILKSSVGDELRVGLVGGRIGKGTISRIDDKAVEMKLSFDAEPPKPSPITLVLALPRPIVLKRLLGPIASFGIKKICIIHSNRVEKSYWNSPVIKDDNIREQLILGLEQAIDTVMPEVILRKKFKPFVEDELPGILKGGLGFTAHPEAEGVLPPAISSPVVLVIGPEGGFIPYEIEMIRKAGCVPVNFGKRILRVETAVVAAIARLGLA